MTGPRAARDRQRVELFYPTIDSQPLEHDVTIPSVMVFVSLNGINNARGVR